MWAIKAVIIVNLLSTLHHPTTACFILFAKGDSNILVANHEDWFASDAAVKINPPSGSKYGSVVFTFLTEGWAQGGMNEKGLFFDGAQTPFQEIIFGSDKQKPMTYPWQEILDKAATVKEALGILQRYSLPELTEATIMLADATGEAVIVGVHNNKLDVRTLSGDYMIQTNFNRWHPELSDEPACQRYLLAEQNISLTPNADVDDLLSILKQTHQDSLTQYSNIYDLTNKTIYTYNKRNFEHPITTALPDIFEHGDCILSLDSLEGNDLHFTNCSNLDSKPITLAGKVVDEQGAPIPYANIGVFEKNIGTLSDPDGTFEITLPVQIANDSLIFSMVGFETKKILIKNLSTMTSPLLLRLNAKATVLNEITVSAKKLHRKVARLGWMGGKDGVLPLDTVMGGGAVALLVEAPQVPFYIEKLQVRLMYNSKDTLKLRFHVYEFDSANRQPGKDLLTREIILTENKKFGWLRFDLEMENILLNERRVCVGFEWIDERKDRIRMLKGLRNWEDWKKDQYDLGNKKVQIIPQENNQTGVAYKYYGNMMDWPGFKSLPPFTGLMVENGKQPETIKLLTFERKTSFGEWKEIPSTLNAVITISY